jgi:hypothetical protein
MVIPSLELRVMGYDMRRIYAITTPRMMLHRKE